MDRVAWIDSQWSHEDVNLIPNGSFEAAGPKRVTSIDANLSEWTVSGNAGLTTTDQFEGKYALIMGARSRVYQVISELTPGKYDLKLWLKMRDEPNAQIYVKFHQNRNGSDEILRSYKAHNEYTLIEINDIEVTNNFLEIGFITASSINSARLWVDNVELRKQNTSTHIPQISNSDDRLKISVDKSALQMIVFIGNDVPRNTPLNIYDSMGRKIYSKTMNSNQVMINHIFDRNQMYIVKVGGMVRKVVF